MRRSATVLSLLMLPSLAQASGCGGAFPDWLGTLKAEAVAAGHPPATVERFFKGAAPDNKVLAADRNQSVFQRNFTQFAGNLISANRLNTARAKRAEHQALLARAAQDYGVPAGILMAFWAFETDFGGNQGDFNTRNALLTLAHDCRRPELFRPQIFAALSLYANGALEPASTTGAWAGEIGMLQMLPADILHRGVDGDGDGRVLLKTSVPDAILSAARMLQDHGWRADEPWLQEITLPQDLDWSLTGLETPRPMSDWQALGVTPREGAFPATLEGAILLPQGHKGPAFMVYPNFRTLFEWNKSFVYVTTAAYFAARVEGAPAFDPRDPAPSLSPDEMRALQEKLQALGHDVGKIDGILGAMTRAAVQKEQIRLGLPADAWPTKRLLSAL